MVEKMCGFSNITWSKNFTDALATLLQGFRVCELKQYSCFWLQ